MKTKNTKRLSALFLVVMMVLTMIPATVFTAFAADGVETTTTETRSIMLGTSHITGGQASNIYFGTYQQSNLGSTQPTEGTEGVDWIKSNATLNNQGPYYKIEPIKWRVLSNADGKLFLLSDQNLDLFMYHTDYEMVTWETSTMRSWLNGYGASSNIGGNSGIDYTNDNFLDTAFSASEQTAIADTAVVNDDNPDYQTEGGENTIDKVFLLSIAEAQNTAYGFTNDDTRKATNTAYVTGGGKTNPNVTSGSMWFLRSPGGGQNQAATVFSSGYVSYMAVNMHIVTVRPAFNLNLSSVLFTSAASGGKADGFNATADYTGTNWKLTLLDTSRSNFTAEILKTSTKTFVSYSGATTGENEYISAMIKDSNGNVTYYGRLKNVTEASGHFAIDEFDIPSKMNDGDTLYIFNEQYNGDNMTDFASELKEVTIPSEINAYEVSFDANGGDGTMSELLLTSSNYTLPEYTLTPPADYGFLGWSYTADGEVINTPTITLTENITLYAKWATQHELIASLEKAVEELNAAVLSNDTDIDTINEKIQEISNKIELLENTYATDTEVKEAIATAKSEAISALESAIDALSGELDNVKSELEAKDSELAEKDSELVAKDNELAEKDSELVAKDAALEKADADNKAAIEAAMNEADSANKTLGIIGLVIGCVSFVGMVAMAVFTFLIKKKQS